VIGREAELEQIEQVLDNTPGGPIGLCIEGTPGIDETTI